MKRAQKRVARAGTAAARVAANGPTAVKNAAPARRGAGKGAPSSRDLLELARAVVRTEAAAVEALEGRLGDEFLAAVSLLAACRGKVIVSGVGKSGLIAHKLAATLTSTGTRASLADIGQTIAHNFGIRLNAGDSFLDKISHG